MVTRQRTPWHALRRTRRLYLYLVPTFAFLALFNYYPAASALYHAFFDWDGVNRATFTGLDNFVQMAHDPVLIASVPHMAFLVLASLVVGLTVPLLVAELIFSLRDGRWSYLYRLLFVVPIVVPLIVVILLWEFVLDPTVGILNGVLTPLHIVAPYTDWLGDPRIALYSLALVGFPWVSGVSVLIYLAGLQGISSSVLDAALLDGATGWRRLRHIDLPLVLGQVKILSVLGIINGVQGFGLQFVMTNGGPGDATMVPGFDMYQQAFVDGKFGYGSAIGLVLFVVILIFTYLNLRFVRSSVEYDAGA